VILKIHAGLETVSDDDGDEEPQGFTMSATPGSVLTPGQLADQIPRDLGIGGAPPALAEAVEAMRKIMSQQSEQLAKAEEENKKFKEKESVRKAIEEENAKKYAESRKPIAEDVLAAFEKAVAEEGLTPLSDGYKKLAVEMLTDNSTLSQEHQAATVACMRKMSKQDKVRGGPQCLTPNVSSQWCRNSPPSVPVLRSWRVLPVPFVR